MLIDVVLSVICRN